MEGINAPFGRWSFTLDDLQNTPSRHKFTYPVEVGYRHRASIYITDLGMNYHMQQSCISDAIAFMQRFYMYHPLDKFHWTTVATTSLYLSYKKSDYKIPINHFLDTAEKLLLSKQVPVIELKPQLIIFTENVMLATFGFNFDVDNIQAPVLRCCQMLKMEKETMKLAYGVANNCFFESELCLVYDSKLVACMCVEVTCLGEKIDIPFAERVKAYEDMCENLDYETLEMLVKKYTSIFPLNKNRSTDKYSISTREQKRRKMSEESEAQEKKNKLSHFDASNNQQIDAKVKVQITTAQPQSNKTDFLEAQSMLVRP